MNARDYPANAIEAIAADFAPSLIRDRLAVRFVLVVEDETGFIGTASLAVRQVNSVFVRPDRQREGIGARLMDAVEAMAHEAGEVELRVNASRTAVIFYERCGYAPDPSRPSGDGLSVSMCKPLGPSAPPGHGGLA